MPPRFQGDTHEEHQPAHLGAGAVPPHHRYPPHHSHHYPHPSSGPPAHHHPHHHPPSAPTPSGGPAHDHAYGSGPASNVGEANPNLYIHNVPKDATEEELKDLFATFGTVDRIRLKVNQKIGPQALYAFVTFGSTAEAQTALERLNGYDMRGRRLRVEYQRSRGDDNRFLSGGPASSHWGGSYDGTSVWLPPHHRRGRSSSLSRRGGAGGRDFPRGGGSNAEWRKRGAFGSNMGHGGPGYYDHQQQHYPPVPGGGPNVPGEAGGPSFKRARHFDGDQSSGFYMNSQQQQQPLLAPVINSQRGGCPYGNGGDTSGPGYQGAMPIGGIPLSDGSFPPRYNLGEAPQYTALHPQQQQPALSVAGGGVLDKLPQSVTGEQRRVTIYLCDLLARLKPELFSELGPGVNTNGGFSAPTQPPTSAPRAQTGDITLTEQQPIPYVVPAASAGARDVSGNLMSVQQDHQKHLITPPVLAQAPEIGGAGQGVAHAAGQPGGASGNVVEAGREGYVWRGSLARNTRRKVPVEVVAMSGPVQAFLKTETLLNISHRSSWEEVLRKSLTATCYVRLSECEVPVGEGGEEKGNAVGAASGVPLTAAKKDVLLKSFQEHVSYLTSKERAGVVTLSEGNHLYVIPPTAPIYDQFRTPAVPTDTPVLIGLFAVPAVVPGAFPTAGTVPTSGGTAAAGIGAVGGTGGNLAGTEASVFEQKGAFPVASPGAQQPSPLPQASNPLGASNDSSAASSGLPNSGFPCGTRAANGGSGLLSAPSAL